MEGKLTTAISPRWVSGQISFPNCQRSAVSHCYWEEEVCDVSAGVVCAGKQQAAEHLEAGWECRVNLI